MENQAQAYWYESVDIYCERLGAGFWAEPVNALTNIFFIIAAFLAFRLWQKSAARSWDMLTLAILMAVVGIGSFTFHTIATRWAGLADVLPIAIFIHFGLGVFLYRVVNLDLMWVGLGVFFFGLFGAVLPKYIPQEFVNRSVQYIPALILLFGMSAYAAFSKIKGTRYYMMGFATFAVSLSIRSSDMTVCAQFPLGIHFMWHILNSIVMYYVFKGIMASSRVSVEV